MPNAESGIRDEMQPASNLTPRPRTVASLSGKAHSQLEGVPHGLLPKSLVIYLLPKHWTSLASAAVKQAGLSQKG